MLLVRSNNLFVLNAVFLAHYHQYTSSIKKNSRLPSGVNKNGKNIILNSSSMRDIYFERPHRLENK